MTPSAIKETLSKLRKKKFSASTNSIWAEHFITTNDFLYIHLALLFQMVFNVGAVPDSLCIGVMRSDLKKNKPKSSCSAYRLVTVSGVFAKIFEFLIVDHLKEKCIIPPFQFRFQSGLGCFHDLRSIYNILRDTKCTLG